MFKTRLKLARLYLSRGDWPRLRAQLAQLTAEVTGTGAGADRDRDEAMLGASGGTGTGMLEVYALQIAMYTATKETKKLAETYAKASDIARAAVPHPSITGAINECGGKLAMMGRDWATARNLFLDAFKSYEEAGDGQRTIACLQYHLLANMLSSSRINPFDSQETKAYERDPQIAVMTSLTDAYLSNNIAAFDKLMRGTGSATGSPLAKDPFIAEYMGDLHASIRAQVAVALVAPYTRVRLSFLASELGISDKDAEALAVRLIVDGALNARIDQVKGVLEMGTGTGEKGAGGKGGAGSTGKPDVVTGKYAEIDRLAGKLQALMGAVATQAVTPATLQSSTSSLFAGAGGLFGGGASGAGGVF